MRQFKAFWNSGSLAKIGTIVAAVLLLGCLSCFGLSALGSFVSALAPAPTPTLFVLPTLGPSVLPGLSGSTKTATLIATNPPTVTMTSTTVETATESPTETPPPTATDFPTDTPAPTFTRVPPTDIPAPTDVPTQAQTFDCSAYRACSTFTTCSQAKAFLEACPQYMNKADSDGDGIPCENVCS